MSDKTKEREVKKVPGLLEQYQLPLIEELKASAFDLLSPLQVREHLGLQKTKDLTELVRQGWLAPAPVEKIGPAHLYYRWRVEFVKRHKRTYEKAKNPV